MLEATGWQTREVVDAMSADSGVPVTRLKVDGGMTANHLLMQFVADVLDVPVERPLGSEAAYAAGLAVGYWSDLEVLRANWHRAAAWEPATDDALRRREHENWGRAVNRSHGWGADPDRRLTPDSPAPTLRLVQRMARPSSRVRSAVRGGAGVFARVYGADLVDGVEHGGCSSRPRNPSEVGAGPSGDSGRARLRLRDSDRSKSILDA